MAHAYQTALPTNQWVVPPNVSLVTAMLWGGATQAAVDVNGTFVYGKIFGGFVQGNLVVTGGQSIGINRNVGGGTGQGPAGAGAADIRVGGTALANRVLVAGGAGAPGTLSPFLNEGNPTAVSAAPWSTTQNPSTPTPPFSTYKDGTGYPTSTDGLFVSGGTWGYAGYGGSPALAGGNAVGVTWDSTNAILVIGSPAASTGGGPGTQLGGGAAGTGGTFTATAGTLGQGGEGAWDGITAGAGGTFGGCGGGGYYGGGGGGGNITGTPAGVGTYGAGGGGGSNYVDASITDSANFSHVDPGAYAAVLANNIALGVLPSTWAAAANQLLSQSQMIGTGGDGLEGFVLLTFDVAPTCSILSPADSTFFDPAKPLTVSWLATMPVANAGLAYATLTNPALRQAGFEIRYQKVGDSGFTTVTQTVNTATSWTLAANTFSVNNVYNIEVSVIDNDGTQSPWSTVTLSAATFPAPATIINPTANEQVETTPVTVGWTLPGNYVDATAASFESGAPGTDYSPNLCTLTDTTVWSIDGNHSTAMVSTSAGNMGATGKTFYPVIAGQTYTAMATYRAASVGRSVLTRINWYNAAKTFLSLSNSAQPVDSTAATATCTAVAPVGAAFAVVVLEVVGATFNLVPHPDFAVTSGVWVNSTGVTYSGGAATIPPVGASGTAFVASTPVFTVVPGTTYTMSATGTVPTGLPNPFLLTARQAVGGSLITGAANGTFTADGTSHPLSVTFTVPAGITTCSIEISRVSTLAGEPNATFSQPQLTATATAQPFLNRGEEHDIDCVGFFDGTVTQWSLGQSTELLYRYTVTDSGGRVFIDSGLKQSSRQNLVANPSFEGSNISSWDDTSYGTPTFAPSSTHAKFGTISGKITWGTSAAQAQGVSTEIETIPGQTYTVSAWVTLDSLTSGGPQLQLAAMVPGGGSPFAFGAESAVVAVGTFVQISCTFQATSDATMLLVVPAVAVTSGAVGYVDGVMAEIASSAGVYFDGSTLNGNTGTVGWSGTTNDSTSNLVVPNVLADTFSWPYGAEAGLNLNFTYSTVEQNGLTAAADVQPFSINFNPPGVPTATVTESDDNAAITLVITNPSGPNATVSNDVYRTDVTHSLPEIRIATGVVVNGTVIDYTPATNTLYTYRIRAFSSAGGFTDSE